MLTHFSRKRRHRAIESESVMKKDECSLVHTTGVTEMGGGWGQIQSVSFPLQNHKSFSFLIQTTFYGSLFAILK